VVLAAVQAAARAGVQGLTDQSAIEMSKRIFFRAMRSLLDHQSSGEVATPGGITERGLKTLGDMTTSFESVFNQMRARADELKT
jgi:pyrroline-5-carboxylate reductase